MAARKSAKKASKTTRKVTAPAKAAKRKVAARPQSVRKAAPKKPANKDLPGKALPGAPRNRASAAPNAVGNEPVWAYLDSLPEPQRAIAKHVDEMLGKTLPGLERCIKWGLAFYGAGNGWVISVGGFVGHVKVNFLHGQTLKPVPPFGQGKYVRGVNLVTMDDVDERQLVAWFKQAATIRGMGAKKR